MATRRTMVIALGGLLAGGGALVGTGAFDSVEAQRSVALETADDSDALLAFEIIDDEHVSETDGTIDFDLVTEAATTYEELVDVRNQGTQVVRTLRFAFDVVGADQPDAVVEDAMRITSGDATIDAIDESNLLVVSDAGDADDDELSPGEAVPFGIEVDLTDVGISSIDGDPEITLTIVADTTAEGESGDGSTGDGPANGGSGGSRPSLCPLVPNVAEDAPDSRVEDGDITLNDGEVDGDVVTEDGSDGDIDVTDATITGGVEADGEVGTLRNATVGGTVRANGGDIGGSVDGSAVNGDVVTASGSDGDIDVANSTVCGEVRADGAVGSIANAEIGGSVESGGDVDMDGASTVYGDLTAGSDATVAGTVEGDASADGDATVGGTVGGNLTTGGDATVTGTVEGDVSAGGDVTVEGTVEGDVSAGGEVDGGGTIGGTDPRSG